MAPLPLNRFPLRAVILLALAAVFGLTAVTMTRRYIGQKEQVLQQERQALLENYQQPVAVVVAAKDLPEGTTLDAAAIRKGEMPEKFLQPYSLRSPSQALGLVTVAPIAESEQILSNKLRRAEEVPVGATLSAVTPKGRRAVTIVVDTVTGVGGFVRPGDTVDILLTMKVSKEGDIATTTLFQDVPVLAVGTEMMASGQARPPQTPAAQGQYTVTVGLNPQETTFLLFAREQGPIQLSLRPRLDKGTAVSLAPATPQTFNAYLQSQLATQPTEAPAPPKPAPVQHEVEIYKGLKRDVLVLSDGRDAANTP